MKITQLSTRRLLTVAVIALSTTGILAGSVSATSAGSAGAKAQRQQQNEARYEQRLQKAVTAGKITNTQEQALLTEHNNLKAQLQAATAANRKQVRKQVRQEAAAWAKQNNVDARWLGGVRAHHKAKD